MKVLLPYEFHVNTFALGYYRQMYEIRFLNINNNKEYMSLTQEK
jgi:hypothetical protein